MQAVYVEPKLTPLTFAEACEAMRFALTDNGRKPSDEVLALALAKSALETGRWKAIWNGNFGNIKAGESYVGMYTCIVLNEVLQGKVVWFAPEGRMAGGRGSPVVAEHYAVPPGHPQTRMRAYANQYDGAQSYVEFVAGGRYKAAWARLLAGDAAGYSRALKAAGYYTADEPTYTKAVVSLHTDMLRAVRGLKPEHEIDLRSGEYDALRTLVVVNRFVVEEYERVREGFGSGAAMQEYERRDTDRSPPPSDMEPNT